MVNKEVAINDINDWLDAKKVSQKKRATQVEQIENLVSEVEEGNLAYDSDSKVLSYKLKFPLEDESGSYTLSNLDFKYRLTSNDLAPYLKGVKPTDADGRLAAYICALTGKAGGYIKKLDTEDLSVAQSIAVFFL